MTQVQANGLAESHCETLTVPQTADIGTPAEHAEHADAEKWDLDGAMSHAELKVKQVFETYRTAIERVWYAGDALIEVKTLMDSGSFEPWLTRIQLPRASAYRWMQFVKQYPDIHDATKFGSIRRARMAWEKENGLAIPDVSHCETLTDAQAAGEPAATNGAAADIPTNGAAAEIPTNGVAGDIPTNGASVEPAAVEPAASQVKESATAYLTYYSDCGRKVRPFKKLMEAKSKDDLISWLCNSVRSQERAQDALGRAKERYASEIRKLETVDAKRQAKDTKTLREQIERVHSGAFTDELRKRQAELANQNDELHKRIRASDAAAKTWARKFQESQAKLDSALA